MSSPTRKIISVLFVDGEAALRESVLAEPAFNREGWVIRAAATLIEAVRMVKEARVDVFIVGARLKDSGPIEALMNLKELSPNSLRFFLHSEAEKALIGKSFSVAHRRLTRDTSPDYLCLAVRQVLVTHMRIRKPEVAAIVRGTKELHVNTQPMQELLATASDPECELETLAGIIRQHPTAVASILQVSNTAFFGANGGVETVEEALSLLGMDFVRNLAITELAKKQLRLAPGLHELANSILQHSIEVSQYAFRMRSQVNDLRLIQKISSIALLHDLGKLVLLAAKGNDYADLMGESVDSGTPCWRLERENYGCDHAAIGGFLFSMWKLPEDIVRSVTWHHEPTKVAEKKLCTTALLHFANYAAHCNSGVSCYGGDRLNEELAERHGFLPDFVTELE